VDKQQQFVKGIDDGLSQYSDDQPRQYNSGNFPLSSIQMHGIHRLKIEGKKKAKILSGLVWSALHVGASIGPSPYPTLLHPRRLSE